MADSRDLLIEILKEKYDYESKRKQYFDDVLGIPITLLSFLIAGVYLVITDTDVGNLKQGFGDLKWFLVTTLLLSNLVTFIFLFKVYFGFNRLYKSLPDSTDIVNVDYKTLLKRHEDIFDSDLQEEYVISDLKEYQIIWYSECNSTNTKLNDNRGNAFYNARISLGISLMIGIFILTFICLSKTNMAQKPSTPPPTPTPVRREKSDTHTPSPQTKNNEQK